MGEEVFWLKSLYQLGFVCFFDFYFWIRAVNKLNSRPRKCLGFKTPYQVFFERTGIDARQLGVVRL
ncbi:Mobile element protein [uncultured Gammaproteobacteria bacterium]|nr:Mobile element protein [uncultured Gammaproteobacteria bacterium]